MIAYKKNELVGITEASKALGNFVDKIASHTIEKIAIIRNNKPEAVMLSIAEYERMKAISEAYEHEQVTNIVNERDHDGTRRGTFDFDSYHLKRKERGAAHVSS